MSDNTPQRAEALLGLANDTARSLGTRFVTFLSVSAYVALTLASTTDEMLLRGSAVILPIIKTEVPLKAWYGFYSIVPWLIVAMHADLLLQFSMLGRKLSHLRALLTGIPPTERQPIEERLSTFYFVQFLGGSSPTRFLNVIAELVVLGTVVALPLALLVWIQLRLLPLHSTGLTLWHQAAVLLDAALIIAMFARPAGAETSGKGASKSLWRPRGASVLSSTGVVVPLCVAFVCFSLVAWLTNVDYLDRWRTLNLREKVLTPERLTGRTVEAMESGDLQSLEQALGEVSRLSFLQGQHLRGANLYHAVLPKLDLRDGTNLDEADLSWAIMPAVLLNDASMRGAKLRGAKAMNAVFENAVLVHADLEQAQLQGAHLPGAQLSPASLIEAKLQGANLSGADLQGARLNRAVLTGASLVGAKLRGADLSDADLRAADLSDAHMEGAILDRARLDFARLAGARLSGASVGESILCVGEDATVARDAGREVPGGLSSDAVAMALCVTEGAEGRPGSARCCDQQTKLKEGIRKLACADGYVARGLVQQAARHAQADKAFLATILLEARGSAEDCPGLRVLLPPSLVAELQRIVESQR